MTAFATYPSLNGRTVLVTGGGSGIGASITEAFARNGAKVAFLDLRPEPAERLAAALAPTVPHAPLFIACDLTDTEALRASIARVRAELGPVAALVNNAGNDERHDLDAVTPDYWDRNIRVNLTHQFFAAQAVRPHMRELGHGSIVNLSSIAWMRGPQRLVAYAAAKAAVVGLTKALAVAHGEAAPALVPRPPPGRRDRRPPVPPPTAGGGRDRAHRAVPGRGRQPDDHQAVPDRGRGIVVGFRDRQASSAGPLGKRSGPALADKRGTDWKKVFQGVVRFCA
jgi:NADP-dependent 3-hydroxy acid dehydrogenase YdfG